MNEQNEFIKNYLHTEYVGCLKTDHEKCIDLQYEWKLETLYRMQGCLVILKSL